MTAPVAQSLLLLALLLPALFAVVSALRGRDSGNSSGFAYSLTWVYAAVAVLAAAAGMSAEGGVSLAAPVVRIGVSNFEVEPRLFLDGRNAPFLLLLGLCPPVVFAFLRSALADRAQAVSAWALVAALAGVFLSDSLLLFYLFWEAALVAVYFWIGLRGGRDSHPALIRFVLVTLAGSLPMLASVAAACAANFRDPGISGLAAAVSHLPDGTRGWVFLGFLLGFAVKLPLLGFHGWLRDTYNAAPHACRALLSAAMSKMGAFGLLLVLAPAFPAEMAKYSLPLSILAAGGALYGGVLMLAQDRLRDLLAYSSLSHLSILALAVFASASPEGARVAGLTGAAWLVLNHALLMAFLFALDARVLASGESPDRLRLSGLRARQGKLFAFLLLAVFASASLPGLNNFPGEILALFAAYTVSPWLAFLGGAGALVGAAALVRLLHAAWLGEPSDPDAVDARTAPAADLGRGETGVALFAAALWLLLGLYPALLLGPIGRAFSALSTLPGSWGIG